jgi:hypothetical protein
MKRLTSALLLTTALCGTALAQVPIQVVATGITNPAGFFEDNGEIFVGGPSIIHLAPADRSNPNPLDTGTYVVDNGLQCPLTRSALIRSLLSRPAQRVTSPI